MKSRDTSRLTLILGGAASGKSEYAEQLALKEGGRRIYLATMQNSESARVRIEKHIKRREGMGILTVEDPFLRGIAPSEGETSPYEGTVPGEKAGVILLEDLPNLLASRMFSSGESPAGEKGVDAPVVLRLMEDLNRLREKTNHLILVSGDLFRDGTVYDEMTEQYLQYLGDLHRRLAAEADRVVEVVCGIPVERGCRVKEE